MKDFRYPVLVFLLTTILLPAYNQVTIFPDVDQVKNSRRIEVQKVELTSDFTIIDFYYAPENVTSVSTSYSNNNEWICVSKGYYITPSGRDERKYLVMAKNISICPKSTKVVPVESDDIIYQLYFPPLGSGIYKIDIVGNKSGGNNFYGVHINNRSVSSGKDSVPYHNQEAFMRYFYAHKDSLDQIEGLWKLKITQQHFMNYGKFIDEIVEKPQIVAIIREGNRFESYGEKGENRHEYFRKLSGKKGYFFRKEMPEVESESSGYAIFGKSDQFFIKYTLPDRLAHYYLLKDYMTGDRLDEIAAYERIPVENPEIKPDLLKIGSDTTGKKR